MNQNTKNTYEDEWYEKRLKNPFTGQIYSEVEILKVISEDLGGISDKLDIIYHDDDLKKKHKTIYGIIDDLNFEILELKKIFKYILISIVIIIFLFIILLFKVYLK